MRRELARAANSALGAKVLRAGLPTVSQSRKACSSAGSGASVRARSLFFLTCLHGLPVQGVCHYLQGFGRES